MQSRTMARALLVLLATIMLYSVVNAESGQTSRDIALNETSLSTDENGSIEAGRPKYNDYALSCVEDKQTTLNCQKEPYKYYCDSKGKLKYSKRETAYCDWCDCINLNPKPVCIINLIGNAQCARDLGNATDLEGMDEFDRAQAVTKQQQSIAESSGNELSAKPGGPAPQLSSAALHGMPKWAKKIGTIVGTISTLVVPSRNSVNDHTVHDKTSDLNPEPEMRDSMKKKTKKVPDCIMNANPMDLSCEIAKTT